MELKSDLEKQLGYNLTDDKYNEIKCLPIQSMDRVRNNLKGKHFNRLYVLDRAPSQTAGGRPITCWWCICSCPEHNILSVRINNLTSGNTKSCGCLNTEKQVLNG